MKNTPRHTLRIHSVVPAPSVGLLVACLLAIVCATDVNAQQFASLWRSYGVTITASDPLRTHIVVSPAFAFDTVDVGGQRYLRSATPGAMVRQSADGSVIQLVISVSIPVANRSSFVLDGVSKESHSLSLPLLADRAPSGTLLQTATILNNTVATEYSGVGGSTAYASVHIVVAEMRAGSTTIYPSTDVVIKHSRIPTLVADGNRASQTKSSNAVQGTMPMGPVAKITIAQEGVYRVTAQQLRDAGLPTDAAAARTIKVLGWGGRELSEQVEPPLNDLPNEQEIVVHTNADGTISEVLFYACGSSGFIYSQKQISHYIHHYDGDAHYLITTAGANGKRSIPRQPADQEAVNKPLQVQGFVFNEDEMVNPYNSGSGRKWLGRTVENAGSLVVSLALPGLVRSGGTVRYNAVVAHRSSILSGMFTIYENNVAVMQRQIDAVPEYMDTYSAPVSGQIDATKLSADGRSTLRFSYSCTDRSSSGLLDWVEVIYPRGMVADDRSFTFFTTPDLSGVTEYSVNGFDNGTIFIFDVTDVTAPQQVANIAPSGGLAVVREALDSGIVRRYYITSNIRSAALSPLPNLTLRSRTDAGELGSLLIITHPDLLGSANRFAQYRSSQGEVTATVVSTTEIMNEFGFGTQDPTAIRDFLAYTYRHAPIKPRYVLLWGDGHYDYKQLSTSQPNYVIPYESLDPDNQAYGLSTYTSDDYFVRLVGNDARIDMAIGRLPVSSDASGDLIREKIDHYEHSSNTDDWRARITLMADDGATEENKSDGDLHLKQSEDLGANRVPDDFQEKKIYLVEYPTDNIARGRRKPGANNDLVGTVNTTGGLLLNWIGHGNPRVWAHEFAFERETTPQRMTNWDKLFFLTAATCDFARFDLTDIQSGAEDLVFHENGGAIGCFSSARVVFSYANAELNKAFYAQLFTPGQDGRPSMLGDVLFTVKQQFMGDNDEKFFLMADPTLRLLIPDHKVVFETINNQQLSDSAIVALKALQTVTVTGHLERPQTGLVDQEFNGVATISLLDGMRNMVVTDDDVAHTVNRFTLPGALLCRGSYKVENGRFTATFVVPKDISFSTGQARLFGYAISSDMRTGRGVSGNLVVDGISAEEHYDTEGPQISLYMDSRLFIGGQVVRRTPVLLVDLSDATGINATGVGVGHDIEANFDNGNQLEILTETFSTSLDNPRSGTAQKQIFGLGAGMHTVTVRAWDVLNNTSQGSTTFRIASDADGVVSDWLMNYPNPFSQSTTIRFGHNAPQPFTALVGIYDIQGRMVYSSSMQIRDMQTAEIRWDGHDSEGNVLGSGVYTCAVQITESDGTTGNVYGKLVLIR